MNALIELKPESTVASVPVPIDPHLDRNLRVIVNKIDPSPSPGVTEFSIAHEDAPSGSVVDRLKLRRQDIDRWMEPAGPSRAASEFKLLFAIMAHKDADQEKAKVVLLGYVKDLMDLPYFALVEACQAFRRGSVGDGQWVPPPGMIRIEAQKRAAALAKEHREINAVLTAQIRPPKTSEERKAEALAYCRGTILPEMSEAGKRAEAKLSGVSYTPPAKQRTKEEWLAHAHEVAARPLPRLSDEALAKFGIGAAP